MATIRTTCPRCGAVEMGPEDVILCVPREAQEGVYRFDCPQCGWTVHKPADSTIVALLLSVGVETRELDETAEEAFVADLAEPRPEGPPITEEEIDAFVRLLADDERLARALTYGVS